MCVHGIMVKSSWFVTERLRLVPLIAPFIAGMAEPEKYWWYSSIIHESIIKFVRFSIKVGVVVH